MTQLESSSEKTLTTSDDSSSICETPLNSFRVFFLTKFSFAVQRREGKFSPGKHLLKWCALVQAYSYTSLVSARLHLKSTVAIGYLAWRIYRMKFGLEKRYNEWLYMSYLADGAIYQIKRLKEYLALLPECFEGLTENTDAETKVNFSYGFCRFVIEPAGMLSFKRGQHPDGIIADDILRDPEKKLDLSSLEKLERVFLEEVMQMPKSELHVFGTPQDEADLLSKLEGMPEFSCRRYPAFDEAAKTALWPEEWPVERLMQRRNTIGDKAFQKEFQCRAVRSLEGFIKPEQYDALTVVRLKNYDIKKRPPVLREWAYGGFDIGKKSHPSHLWVLGVDRKGHLIQLHSKFMDGWDYVDQLEYLRVAVKTFKMAKVLYDDTRAEFESFVEAGKMPGEMEGLAFTAKNKYSMATEVDSMITSRSIRFLADKRQRRQILSVDNDLKAVATEEGHGDCFFSLCLAVRAYREGQGLGVFVI